MPGVSRKTTDIAGSIIISGRLSVTVNNDPIACQTDVVQPHSPGGAHTASLLIANTGASAKVYAEGLPVSAQGDGTTCGHVVATGSSNVNVGLPNNN